MTQPTPKRRRAAAGSFLLLCWLAFAGCTGSDGSARHWLDPLGLAKKPELSEEPDFRKRVSNDPFPAASQAGLATPAAAR
jgi:hypothetical protein